MISRRKSYSVSLDLLLNDFVSEARLENIIATGITLDSRKVKEGMIFVAVKGETVNGIEFINNAIDNGAVAVLWEAEKGADVIPVNWRKNHADEDIPVIAVSELSEYVGSLADRFYQSPSKQISVVGITGTNGKTSCAHFVAQAISKNNLCGIMGTLGAGLFPSMNETGFTTPDAVTCHQWLSEIYESGAKFSVMEVSSHALEQGRVNGIRFNSAVFTNISRDHLDYHGDMQSYINAKARLFNFTGLENAVINTDDEAGRSIASNIPESVNLIRYGLQNKFSPDVYGYDIRLGLNGLKMKVKSPWGEGEIVSSLIGEFNASNLLAVLAVLLLQNIEFEECITHLNQLESVPGRMQGLRNKTGPLVIVDFAHSPDALDKALDSIRKHTNEKLWCVFGCGGDRDKGKRAIMGKIAEKKADFIVLTNDNPRTESPVEIIKDIQSGIDKSEKIVVEYDRRQAISYAIQKAASGDVVLIAGKGHERYQLIGEEKIPFSDIDEVQQQLKATAV